MMLRSTSLVSAVILALSLSACGRGFQVNTPDGFIELEDQHEYAYRATSAYGVVLAVRTEPNKPRGNLDFWTAALDLKLRNQGYVLEGLLDAKAAGGLKGKKLRYSQVLDGRPHTLWITIFVTDTTVFCVETGGDARNFEKVESTIDKAIASLQVN